MKRILHLVDDSFCWEQASGLNPLRNRLTSGYFHVAASVGRPADPRLLPKQDIARHFSAQPVTTHVTGQMLARWIERERIDLVHAWGLKSGIMAMTALQGSVPVATSFFDPRLSDHLSRALRALIPLGGHALICSAATVQRRLIEKGVEIANVVLVRPGIDFGAINQYRREAARWRNTFAAGAQVFVTADASTDGAGQDIAAHAAVIRRHVDSPVRVILPGVEDPDDRSLRWVTSSGFPNTWIPDAQLNAAGFISYEQKLALADVLLLPVHGDVSSTGIAWAMASSVLVIAGAVYSTSELLAHQQNSLLLKPREPRHMAFKIAAMLGDLSLAPRLTDTARGQAFEVFSQRRYLDQIARVYSNLWEGKSVGDGVADPSLVA